MVLVCLHNSLVHDLLQLLVFQIASHHHLEYNEKLAVADVAVAVDIVDLERDTEPVDSDI